MTTSLVETLSLLKVDTQPAKTTRLMVGLAAAMVGMTNLESDTEATKIPQSGGVMTKVRSTFIVELSSTTLMLRFVVMCG